jgi:hypothetical protein
LKQYRAWLTAFAAAGALALPTLAAPPATSPTSPLQNRTPGAVLRPLFAPAAAAAPAASVQGDSRRPRRAVLTISSKPLALGVIADADAHLFNLFPDASFVALRNRVESRRNGDYSWFGSIPGDEFGRAILTVVGDKLGVYVASRGRTFIVLPIDGGLYEASEIVPGELREGKFSEVPDTRPTVTGMTETRRTAKAVGTGSIDNGGLMRWFNVEFAEFNGDVPGLGAVEEDGRVIDVVALYSHGAADLTDLHQNSPAHTSSHAIPVNLLVRIQQGFDVANQSLVDSGVATSFNLLWVKEEHALVDSGDTEVDVNVWQTIPAVNAFRDSLAADIVVFYTGSWDGFGGHSVGEFSAVGATSYPNVTGHEIGHTMGLEHDWDTCVKRKECLIPDDWTMVHKGNHGYVQVETGLKTAYRSMMAYATVCESLKIPDCQWAARWSDPNFTTPSGQPFGVPEGQAFPADEVQRLNQTRVSVANRRLAGCRLLSSC